MSVRPIDYQMMIPKAAEVSRITSDLVHKESALHKQQIHAQIQSDENKLKQVYDKDKAFEASIKQKQERNAKKKSEDKKNSDENKKEKDNIEKQQTRMPISTIDIKI